MDILRKELNAIYASQELDKEVLDTTVIDSAIAQVKIFAAINNCCCVITDAAADKCYIMGGSFCKLLGVTDEQEMYIEADSSDEDEIYIRMHPEDLAEKRMLEYEYFKHVDSLPGDEKTRFKASCTIRIKDRNGDYISVSNSTQVLVPSPAGKTWLILCCYDLSPAQQPIEAGINPRIVNNSTGEVIAIHTEERRQKILTEREKEILRLIQQGKPSKQIADILKISIHTVSRHRQNIISKLSVGNTVEAITAANMMRLLR